jgi:hypothetical protein
MRLLTNEQKHQRLQQLFAFSRQRYLNAGGRPTGHADGNLYMTSEEKQEFLAIARSLRQTPATAKSEEKTQVPPHKQSTPD